MLSWEYPPYNVGGLGRHVSELAGALVKQGCEVHVLTRGEATNSPEIVDGVIVHRVNGIPINAPDFLTWVLQLNLCMSEALITITQSYGPFTLVHAHDWLAAFAGRIAKNAYQLPLVATIHATEVGRNHGLHNDWQRYISSAEWWLTYEAWKVIVCSQYMFNELQRVFQTPADKLQVIPNGIKLDNFRKLKQSPEFKQRYAHPEEKIIYSVGRLVHEKGIQVLLEATPKVLAAVPEAKLIISGTGPMEFTLKERAKALGLGAKIYFTGYVDDNTRDRLYREANVAVFPSLYEPFGIVALEAMAAGVPVVVTDTGGMGEIVIHGQNGLKAWPGSVDALADQLTAILRNNELANRLRQEAREQLILRYNWDQIAKETIRLYRSVSELHAQSRITNNRWSGLKTWQRASALMGRQRHVREQKVPYHWVEERIERSGKGEKVQ